jgi:hypothetical protein
MRSARTIARWLCGVLPAVALLLTVGSVAGAQDAGPPPAGEPVINSWSLAPSGSTDPGQPGNRPFLSYETTPGGVLEDSVTLYNYGNVAMTFRVYATDAFNNDDGQFDLLPGDQTPTDVGSWVTLPQANLTVPARSQASMPITVRVPEGASPGDHAGAILASSSVGGSGPDGKVVTLDRRTGARLYVRVAGPLVAGLAVEEVRSTYHPSLNPLGGRLEVTYRVENHGNVRLGAAAHVTAAGPLGLLGRRASPVDLPELLPGEGTDQTVTFTGVPATAVVTADVALEPATARGGDPEAQLEGAQARALAVPFSILAVGLVILLVRYAIGAARDHRSERLAGVPVE